MRDHLEHGGVKMAGGDFKRDYQRKFLVIIDETEECDRAVTFAANRVKRTGGTVVLLSIIGGEEFQHWIGVGDIMRAEATQDASRLLDERAERIGQIGDINVEKVIREGRKSEAIRELVAEDGDIAILVLAAGTSSEGPGPLVSEFAAQGANALRIPVTIVPGNITDEEIAAIC